MAERYIPEHRRTQFKAKNQFKPDELRRRREEQQVEIRKQKREENLAKRRGIQTRDGGIGVGGGVAATDSDEEGGTNESEVSLLPIIFPILFNHLPFSCLFFSHLHLPYCNLCRFFDCGTSFRTIPWSSTAQSSVQKSCIRPSQTSNNISPPQKSTLHKLTVLVLAQR